MMKTSDEKKCKVIIQTVNPTLDRRTFLASTGILASSASLGVFGGQGTQVTATWSAVQPAVFNSMPYFNFDGTGTQYNAPRVSGANKSTRKYVDSISHEEYLRRHWFI